MYSIGEKIIYGENGVCTVEKIAPVALPGVPEDRLYYHLSPLIGSGTYYAAVEGGQYMRPVMGKDEAMAFIASIPSIEPAICEDNRFNHVDAFYRELFKKHSVEVLVSVIKGLSVRMEEKKTKSSRAEATMKRAKEILFGELSVALGMDYETVEEFVRKTAGL